MNFVAAILYAVSASSLLAVLLAFLRGGLNPSAAATAIAGGLFVASFTLWRDRNSVARWRLPSIPEWLAIVAFTLVSLRIFLWVVFIDGDDVKVLSPNNLGDLSLHLTYVRYLASGVPFWPDNPIFTGGKLTYPIGVDLFQSLLVLLGVNVFRGFVWIGLIGAALTGAALWRWGRGLTLFGFLANGGLAGFAVFNLAQVISSRPLADFQEVLGWKSIALSIFATQRGFLFAFPAGLLLLSSWRSRFFSSEDDGWRLPRWGEILLYASLPLFHFHTFIFLSVLLGVWFIWQAPARRELLILVGASFIPATLLVLLITGGLHSGNLLGWKLGWMWDDDSFLDWCKTHWHTKSLIVAGATFWPLNFGILPVLVIFVVVRLFGKQTSSWPRAIVFPSLTLFLVCCFVKFAPWAWDNTKLMVWSYLLILPFAWKEVQIHWPRWSHVPVFILLFFSGFVSTLGGIDSSHTGYEIAERSTLDSVERGVRYLPVTARFAGAPTYNHPLLLNGRKMVLGYLGHVSSHGLPWEEPSAKLETLMSGEGDWRSLATELGARYIYWGKDEQREYEDSKQPWRRTTRLVAAGPWGEIYDLNSPPDPSPPLPEMKE